MYIWSNIEKKFCGATSELCFKKQVSQTQEHACFHQYPLPPPPMSSTVTTNTTTTTSVSYHYFPQPPPPTFDGVILYAHKHIHMVLISTRSALLDLGCKSIWIFGMLIHFNFIFFIYPHSHITLKLAKSLFFYPRENEKETCKSYMRGWVDNINIAMFLDSLSSMWSKG